MTAPQQLANEARAAERRFRFDRYCELREQGLEPVDAGAALDPPIAAATAAKYERQRLAVLALDTKTSSPALPSAPVAASAPSPQGAPGEDPSSPAAPPDDAPTPPAAAGDAATAPQDHCPSPDGPAGRAAATWTDGEDGPDCECGWPRVVKKLPDGSFALMCLGHTGAAGAISRLPAEKPGDWAALIAANSEDDDETPAREELAASAAPAGPAAAPLPVAADDPPPALRGKAWRDAAKRARSLQNAILRRKGQTYTRTADRGAGSQCKPGMGRRMPPEPPQGAA